MSGRMEADADAVEDEALAEIDRLLAAAELRAAANAHDVEGLPCRQNLAVPRSGMVGMPVGDQRPLHRPYRIDVEVACRAIEARLGRMKQGFGLDHETSDRAIACPYQRRHEARRVAAK